MNFQFNNKNIDNPLAKIFIVIIALFIVIAVLGLIGLILLPVAVIVVIIIFFVALIVPIVAVFGAGRWMKGIHGSGEILTEYRDVKEFTGISLELPCELEIERAEEQEVTIETDDNILGYILSYVQDGILNINSNNKLSFSKKILVKIKTNNLSQLTISGSAKVKIINIEEEKLKLKISGSAKAMGNGNIHDLNIIISGMGTINFKEIKTKNTRLRISGSGKADLFVEESLDATINGTGKANVWGNPANVSKHINGLGKINIL